MRVWRISSYVDLSGKGGFVTDGRWHPLNTPIVYCADHPASSLLEMLAHIDAEDAPPSFQLLGIDLPDGISIEVPDLVGDWANDQSFTQGLGKSFIASGRAAVLQVPSVIVPFAWHYLLNPAMVDATGIRIESVTRHPIDPRLIDHITS